MAKIIIMSLFLWIRVYTRKISQKRPQKLVKLPPISVKIRN